MNFTDFCPACDCGSTPAEVDYTALGGIITLFFAAVAQLVVYLLSSRKRGRLSSIFTCSKYIEPQEAALEEAKQAVSQVINNTYNIGAQVAEIKSKVERIEYVSNSVHNSLNPSTELSTPPPSPLT